MQENIQSAIQQALDESPERKFVESVEMAFTLRDVDLKNPTNRIQEEVRLPTGRGKPIRITMFAGGEMATKAKAAGIDVIDPSTIEDLGGNRQQARKMANKSDFFLSEIPHMGTVGRFLGVVLGPRGKMPRRSLPILILERLLPDSKILRLSDHETVSPSTPQWARESRGSTTSPLTRWLSGTGSLANWRGALGISGRATSRPRWGPQSRWM